MATFCRFSTSLAVAVAAGLLAGCGSSQSAVPGAAEAARERRSSSAESVLYSFKGPPDGVSPMAGLVADANGALYGTTVIGGLHASSCGSGGCGTVFKLTPTASGYTERVIHHFSGPHRPQDGVSPTGGLLISANGTLYGTTYAGGGLGRGTIFRLTPVRSHYEEKILYRFSGTDGATPYAGLTAGPGGTLYGTTFYGGSYADGTVFKFVLATGALTTLHAFGAPYRDGAFPMGAVTLDDRGNIYGTTEYGGHYCTSSSACGTVFKLTRTHAGYQMRTLYEFHGRKDGANPTGSLVVGGDGTVYGTTEVAGLSSGCGTIFALRPHGPSYKFSVIYSFTCGPDGGFPVAGPIAATNGALYGTTEGGGNSCNRTGCGTVYELTPTSSGGALNVLWSFQSSGDGNKPAANLLLDASGALYGTTTSGGLSGSSNGTVFKVLP